MAVELTGLFRTMSEHISTQIKAKRQMMLPVSAPISPGRSDLLWSWLHRLGADGITNDLEKKEKKTVQEYERIEI